MNAAGASEMQALTFELSGEVFALEAGIVQEVLDLLPETRVPGAPRFADAVINFRGQVIPLADLRVAFGMDRAENSIDSRIVVIELDLEGEPALIGLRTDRVCEVATLGLGASEPAPSVGMRWPSEYVRRLIKRAGDFVVLPDLQAIFAPQPDAPAASQLRH